MFPHYIVILRFSPFAFDHFLFVVAFYLLLVQYTYKAGNANTEFAKRFGHLADVKVKTVGEAFADFTKTYGTPVNPLYKNMITDIVGTTHLTLVNCRFERDPIWSLGLLTSLDLLLKNYPEPENGPRLVSCFMKSMGLDEAQVRAEAATMQAWATTAGRAEVEAALTGQGSSALAAVARKAKEDQFWMYSRYFGIGLLKIMECTGVEMEKDEAYPIMEDWMKNKFGRSAMTACVSIYDGRRCRWPLGTQFLTNLSLFDVMQSDSDLYFKVREKLDMMETMMKEIEIREKKRMAERLEEKAEAALRAADREVEMQKEIAAERESVGSA